jgi:pSer/pThr/pTyr-binding forkhead associated (FHA) protein
MPDDDPRLPGWLTPVELKRVLEAERDGSALLLWKDDAGRLQILRLEPDGEYYVGRGEGMAISLPWDTRVSALHARIAAAGGEWLLADDGWSTNGTYLNDKKIDRSTRLRHKDVIRTGRTQLSFRATPAAKEMTTALDDPGEELPTFDATDHAILVELCRRYFAEELLIPVENKAIAEALHFSEETVSARFRRMYSRAGINLGKNQNRAALMSLVIRKGVVTPRDYR